MKGLGVLFLLIGAGGAMGGPIDPAYLEDWVAFLFFLILTLLGFYMILW